MSHQKQLHDSRAKRLVAVTGRQIGKTVAAVNELIKRGITNPGSRNWYVTNDYKQAKRNVWDLLKEYLPLSLIKSKNEGILSIKLTNDSLIELIGVENAESLRGAKIHFMVCDEYADFAEGIFSKVLEPMLTTTDGDVWFLGTPKGLSNDLYKKYIDSGTESFKFPSCEVVDSKVINPISTYAKLQALQKAFDDDRTPGKLTFSQEYLAEFTRPQGTVYQDWKLENFKPIAYDAALPVHVSIDFGINDPTAIIWIQPQGSEYRVIDYHEESNASVDHYVQLIRSKPYKVPELVTGDDAGRARTLTTGTSVIDEFSKSGIFIRTTPGLRITDQIRITHKYIHGLFVSDKLTRFRDCILNYRYPEMKGTERNQSNENPIHNEHSHAMRALEYYFVNFSTSFASTNYIPRTNDLSKWRIGAA